MMARRIFCSHSIQSGLSSIQRTRVPRSAVRAANARRRAGRIAVAKSIHERLNL